VSSNGVPRHDRPLALNLNFWRHSVAEDNIVAASRSLTSARCWPAKIHRLRRWCIESTSTACQLTFRRGKPCMHSSHRLLSAGRSPRAPREVPGNIDGAAFGGVPWHQLHGMFLLPCPSPSHARMCTKSKYIRAHATCNCA